MESVLSGVAMNFFIRRFLLVISACVLVSCGSHGSGSPTTITPPGNTVLTQIPQKNIQLGTETTVFSANAETTGTTIQVASPGSAIDKMTVTVPAAAYDQSQPFAFSTQPIIQHDLGTKVLPLTPMIHVDNGGKYSNDIMTLTIPVTVPANHFAMAFYYDDVKKRVEGMPFLKHDATSVTVATRHFSKFFVSAIPIETLRSSLPLMTDYQPGLDDWEFPNWGSYIAPKGHCAGQSVTSIWYFLEMARNGSSRLNGLLDNNYNSDKTPDIWKDDSYGYRFASVVQNDFNWTNWQPKIKTTFQQANPSQTWMAFAYALLVTEEPQLVFIQTADASAGHAMVVYGIDETGPEAGELYIADPNYPGKLDRKIVFTDKYTFVPYNSAENAKDEAAGKGIRFDYIYYPGNTALLDFPKIADRWSEVEAGTIGKDSFLDCKLHVIEMNGNDVEVSDNYWQTTDALVSVYAACKDTDGNDSGAALLDVYLPGQSPFSSKTIYQATLVPNEQKIGFYLTDGGGNYIDFQWLTISSKPPEHFTMAPYYYSDIIYVDDDFSHHPPPYECTGYFEAPNISDPSDSAQTSPSSGFHMFSATVVSTFPLTMNVNAHCTGFWDQLAHTFAGGNTLFYYFNNSSETLVLTDANDNELTDTSTDGNFSLYIDKSRAKRVTSDTIKTNMFMVSFHIKTKISYNNSVVTPEGVVSTSGSGSQEFFNTFYSITVQDPSLPAVETISN